MTKTVRITRSALKARRPKQAEVKLSGTTPIMRDTELIASVLKRLKLN